ncbi:8-oxo-dGTP diphosphatase [Marisediminicola sp. UYEF4]|uniref:(deoxy)nucleoside triphosphate pyrophosphohydrolase n=1 Tax=Marisediminicola sp. UYEF4 TaxID=1756384 RepID=UPI00339B0B77
MKKHLEVVGAVIVRDGSVLCAQRGTGLLAGMWEFPGGKVENGESPRAALAREILEELNCHVSVGDEVTSTTHEYEFAVVSLTTYYCELTEGVPEVSEHEALAWLLPGEFQSVEWAPADIPAVELIQHKFVSR